MFCGLSLYGDWPVFLWLLVVLRLREEVSPQRGRALPPRPRSRGTRSLHCSAPRARALVVYGRRCLRRTVTPLPHPAPLGALDSVTVQSTLTAVRWTAPRLGTCRNSLHRRCFCRGGLPLLPTCFFKPWPSSAGPRAFPVCPGRRLHTGRLHDAVLGLLPVGSSVPFVLTPIVCACVCTCTCVHVCTRVC